MKTLYLLEINNKNTVIKKNHLNRLRRHKNTLNLILIEDYTYIV